MSLYFISGKNFTFIFYWKKCSLSRCAVLYLTWKEGILKCGTSFQQACLNGKRWGGRLVNLSLYLLSFKKLILLLALSNFF